MLVCAMWEKRPDLKIISIFTDHSMAVLPFWIFLLLMFRVCHAILSSVYCSLVVFCWEWAELLALLYVMFYCVLSLSDGVSWVKFGT